MLRNGDFYLERVNMARYNPQFLPSPKNGIFSTRFFLESKIKD